MKFFNLKLGSKWFVTWLSVATFVVSPVAMGQEAEIVSTQQVKNALEQMGLNKKITVGEFYQNTKNLYPERIRSQIEPVLMNFKNTMMPEFTVSTVKGTDGREIPNIQMSYNGQLLNFQWFGEKEKFIKFQNTNLTEIDLINFNDMFTRVMAADETLRRQVDGKPASKPTILKKASQFEYPTVTQELWKSMTPQDRANYMINLRLLWSDARKVLSEIEKNKTGKNKKTTSIDKLDLLWKNLIVQDVEAAKSTKTLAGRVKVIKPVAVVSDSKVCLVAGYVTSYNSQYCDHKNIKNEYLEIPDVKKANSICGPTKLACNPIVFGTPNGNPICIEPKTSNASFQIATHYDGPCETINSTGNNHLGSEIHFLKDETKQAGRYSADNIAITDIKAEVKKELNGNYKATEDFLNGLLKFRGVKDNLFTAATIDANTLEQIIQIKNQFEGDIVQATSSCKVSSNDGSHKDKNFWKACDQLQRRFIFIEEYLQQKCPAGSTINDKYKCSCGSGDKTTEVSPGEKSCVPPVTTPPLAASVPVEPKPPVQPTQPVSTECPAGTVKKITLGEQGTPGEGAESVDCVPFGKKPIEKEGHGVWEFMKKLAPFAIGGVALFAMYKLFSPKKPTLNPAGDFCLNGLKPPCGQTCAPPLAIQPGGACGCTVCAPGQNSDATTCLCSSSPVTPISNILTCPDGFTKVTNLTTCPVTNYNCWNGSKVSNPLYCPEKPATVTPKTTQ